MANDPAIDALLQNPAIRRYLVPSGTLPATQPDVIPQPYALRSGASLDHIDGGDPFSTSARVIDGRAPDSTTTSRIDGGRP